jgi:hypothetical protein
VKFTARGVERLPDHIIVFPGHIAVASESVVSGHDLGTGGELWRIELTGTDYLTHAVARSQVTGFVGIDPAGGLSAVAHNYLNNMDAMHTSSDRYIKRSRQNYTNVYNRTQKIIKSGNNWEKEYARFERGLAASHVQNAHMINRSFDNMMLSVNTALNAFIAAQAVEKNARIGAAAAAEDRAIKRMLLSYKIHESGLQGDFYLRPFRSRGGNGVVLVNMRKGTWAEIPTGPSETILEDKIYMNIILGLLVDNTSLVTIGTGLDKKMWRKDKRFQTSKLQEKMFAFTLEDRNLTTMILRSLLSYNIKDATFHPASAYEKVSLSKQKSRIVR